MRMFKGIESLEIDAGGESINIYGDNATGKTTIADAVSWLLFDKDTANKSPIAFGIKTVDENGATVRGADHTVEGTFQLEDFPNPITLRKVYKENWTKGNGSKESVLKNHTTDYYWDKGEPVSATEYSKRLDMIMSSKLFKILSLPDYFAESKDLSQADKIEILSQLCGNVKDEDILALHPELYRYVEVLDGLSEEAQSNILKERKKFLNKELKEIPSRIDEKNAHLQCPNCNSYRGGEQFEHGLKVDEKYGEGTADSLRLKSRMKSFRKQYDYEFIAEEYHNKAKTLQKKAVL